MTHPDTYTLTREEWLRINRTLAGAALALSMPRAIKAKECRVRLLRVRDAQDILSASYDRADVTNARG